MSLSSGGGDNASHGGDNASTTSSDRVPTTYTIPDPSSVEELGRTFHGYREGKYLLPNDGEEQDRLDLQHKIWLLIMKGSLYWAPIEKPKNVLDAGTGTGIWAIQFAKQHPEANVVGSDLSLIQPSNVPSNCTFIREDLEEEWIHQQPFDFVHLRAMCTCFSNPQGVMQTIFDNLAPGGWCEYHEYAMDSAVGSDPASEELLRNSPVSKFINLMILGMKNIGRDITVANKYKKWMQEVGFTEIVERQILCPITGWPLNPEDKLLGQFYHLHSEKAMGSMVKLLVAAGMTMEEIPKLIQDSKLCLSNANFRVYIVSYVVYGRKPEWTMGYKAPSVKAEG